MYRIRPLFATVRPASMLLGAITLAGLAGCVGPKYVVDSTGSGNQIKLVYSNGSNVGLVKCQRSDDGVLKDCREMPIILQEDK